MPRSRVQLKLIENEDARRTTYKKRKEWLCKKMEEISTLCDVKGCMILRNPEFESEGQYVWRSDDEASELLKRLQSLPRCVQTKKMVNHDEFTKRKIAKLRDEVRKQEAKNKKIEASILIHKISNGGMDEIKETREARLLAWFAEEKMKEIQMRKYLFPPLQPLPAKSELATMDPNSATVSSSYGKNIRLGDSSCSSGTKETKP